MHVIDEIKYICLYQVDRIYLSSSDVVALFDHGSKRTFQIRKQGLPDVGKCIYPSTHIFYFPHFNLSFFKG